ncbi:DUF1963 domain-containing protein [Aneurinibacillus migulanus]|uniref:DUF1963 domain-containing protein n=1 Tax=Aneurinibacillus migulanus TaxID=47500 RepID=UPI00399D3BAE
MPNSTLQQPSSYIHPQYNLEEMNEVPFPTCLPAKGMLYFFYQADEQEVWGEKEHN